MTVSIERGFHLAIDAQRRVIANMDGWAQIVEVFNVSGTDIATAAGNIPDGSTDFLLVRVTITYQRPGDATAEQMRADSASSSRAPAVRMITSRGRRSGGRYRCRGRRMT